MNVMIFEPRIKGHHFFYVRLLARELLALGCRVICVVAPEAPASIQFTENMGEFARDLTIVKMKPWAHSRGVMKIWYAQLAGFVRMHRPDHLLVPTGDGFIQQCGLMRITARGALDGVEAEGDILQCRFAYRGNNLKERLRRSLSRYFLQKSGFSTLFTIDSVALEEMRRQGYPLGRQMKLLPDPVEPVIRVSKQEARTRLGIPIEGRCIGVVGNLDARKGVDRLLRAFAKVHRPQDRLVLVGEADEDTRAQIMAARATPWGQTALMWIDAYVDSATFLNAITALDVVAAPYIGHFGPSGIAVRAAQLRRPVLSADFGWMGRMVPCLRIGVTCDVQNDDAFAAALAHQLEHARDLPASALLDRYVDYLSGENFAAMWLARIRQRLGLAPARVLEWDAVFGEDNDGGKRE